MKVTKRLPLNPRYAEYQQFSEMRYFRFGERSTAAAILFGLFEELRLPLFQSLRKSICKQVDESTTVRNKRVLSFLLEPRVRPECMFAAWNYDELILDAVIEAVGQLAGDRGRQRENVIHMLRRKFAFQLLNIGEKSSPCMQIPTIYLDTSDLCAVLLYPGRTMDSFLVTKCRHIYVKADFMSGSIGTADTLMSHEDSEICKVKGCSQLLEFGNLEGRTKSRVLPSHIYYDLVANHIGNTLEKYYREVAIEPPKCQYCGVRNAPCQCSARCRICIECALVAYCSYGHSFICPVCGERLSKELCILLVDELPRRISWAPLPQFNASCDYCRQSVAIEDVKEISQGEKLNFACAACLTKLQKPRDSSSFPSSKPLGDTPVDISLPPFPEFSAPFRHGRLSSESVSSPTQASFSRLHQRSKSSPPRQESFRHPPIGDFIENCHICGRQTSCYTVMKALRHGCWVCDDCIYAFYDAKWVPTCPICHVYVGNFAFKAIQTWTNTLNAFKGMNLPTVCSLCSQSQPRKFTLKSARLSHLCTICDLCLLSSLHLTICPSCSQPYSQQDIAILTILKGRVRVKVEREVQKPRKCIDCAGKVEGSQPSCPNACLCSRCLLQNYVFSNSRKCPECKNAIKGPLPDTVLCTSCSRMLIIREESMNTVSGVCENACILCCFCIKLANMQAICSICEANVDSIERKHILKWQKGFKLGCYCGKEKGAKVIMPCGCKAHADCWPGLALCRLCGREYRKQQQIRRLTSYFT